MHLDTQGKAEDVPEIAIAITYETHGIDVIGSQLIKERDALDALTHIVRYHVFEAFTEGDVRTDASRERIIAFFLLGRLLGPKIMSEDGIEIDAALQRFKPPSLTNITAPGNEILLQRERYLRLIGIKARNISQHYKRLPLAALAVIPSDAQGNHTHVTTGLYHSIGRNQQIPMLTVFKYSPVIAREFTLFIDDQCIMNNAVIFHIVFDC